MVSVLRIPCGRSILNCLCVKSVSAGGSRKGRGVVIFEIIYNKIRREKIVFFSIEIAVKCVIEFHLSTGQYTERNRSLWLDLRIYA